MNNSKPSLLILIFVSMTICHGIPRNIGKRSAIGTVIKYLSSKISGNSVRTASKTMSSAAVGYYMSQVPSGLSITILNSMESRYLVNPRLFLVQGKAVGPPMLIIPPRAKDQNDAKLLFLEKNPKGILCYELWTDTKTATKLICLYFLAVDKKELEYDLITSNDLSILQEKDVIKELTSLKSISADKTIGENSVYEDEAERIDMITQMTTGDNTRLFLEVKDKPMIQSVVLKRELMTAVAVGLVGGAASALASAAKKYIATKYGTILTLENLSNNNDAFFLYDPIW